MLAQHSSQPAILPRYDSSHPSLIRRLFCDINFQVELDQIRVFPSPDKGVAQRREKVVPCIGSEATTLPSATKVCSVDDYWIPGLSNGGSSK